MKLEEAIKEKDKIFPMKDMSMHMIIEEQEKYVELIKRLYDKRYELIKRGRKSRGK